MVDDMENKNMKDNEKSEILFYYESRQNPNGDPGFENQPRKMSDDRIIVTDVRIKRTIRDYAKNQLKEDIFVDYNEDGEPVQAQTRAADLLKKLSDKDKTNYNILLEKTFDVPLFGVLIPIPKANKKDSKKGDNSPDSTNSGDSDTNSKGSFFKITGPVQFGIGYSINKPEIISPTITSHFVGKDKSGDNDNSKNYGSFGKFYSVNYALIKVNGVINPNNLEEHFSNANIKKNFDDNILQLKWCLWNGTNSLVTRSKYPQRSILYIEVTYKDGLLFNDLGYLIREKESLTGDKIKEFDPDGLDFSELEKVLIERKDIIDKITIISCHELNSKINELKNKLNNDLLNKLYIEKETDNETKSTG